MIVHTLMMCTGDAGPEQNLFLFIFKQPKRYNLCPCQKVCDALHYLLDTIFIRFSSKMCIYNANCRYAKWIQIVLLLLQICYFFCYERDFMLSFSDHNQVDVVEALTMPQDI